MLENEKLEKKMSQTAVQKWQKVKTSVRKHRNYDKNVTKYERVMKKHHKLVKKESYKNSEPTEKQLKTIAN